MGNCCSPSYELIEEYKQGLISDKLKLKSLFISEDIKIEKLKYGLRTIHENSILF